MPKVTARVGCPVHDSFRVQQVAGMFDLPLAERVEHTFDAEVPDASEPWSIGLIVGPSGSGKTTLARAAFADAYHEPSEWPAGRAVVDGFGDTPTREVTELFTAVGFGSPPSWIKPYAALSNGERFRCDLARSLAGGTAALVKQTPGDPAKIVVFDEFTSVVDRTVAKVASAAIAKAVRSGRLGRRFVAVSCHYDIAEWLEPDWVLDTATGTLTRRRLRRSPIDIKVHRCRLAAWRLFARHHYLSGSLAPQSCCYVAAWGGEPVAFAALLPVIGRRGRRRFTRIVTLPDYQGMGIGMRTAEAVADLQRQVGRRVNVTSSHPALIGHCRRSDRWRAIGVKRNGQAAKRGASFGAYRDSAGRAVVSFEYLGSAPPHDA
ncbi:GNAT family N-acetyltransferase [Botrimarina sp.]|uniref:GNAT family N-acetyltransferase n=1 Tax=Botrimarina sp. TaxID=2795802 RepID=UPI0032EC1938